MKAKAAWDVLSPLGNKASWMPPCKNESCRAAHDLACVLDAMGHRDLPNSLAYDTIAERDRDFRSWIKRIHAFDRSSARRGPLLCGWLAHIASHVQGNREADDTTVMSVVELAARLDRRGVRCSPVVMAAFPRTEAVHASVVEGGRLCYDESLRPACGRIAATWSRVRPAPPPPMPEPRGTPPRGTR